MRADPVALESRSTCTSRPLPFFINYGGEGPASAKLVSGYLACDARPFNPLLENLPPVIKAGDPQDSDAGWLRQFIRFAVMTNRRRSAPGAKRPRQDRLS